MQMQTHNSCMQRRASRKSRSKAAWLMEETGQASTEYVLVVAVFLAACVALGLVWVAARNGSLEEIARESASHVGRGNSAIGAIQDLALF